MYGYGEVGLRAREGTMAEFGPASRLEEYRALMNTITIDRRPNYCTASLCSAGLPNQKPEVSRMSHFRGKHTPCLCTLCAVKVPDFFLRKLVCTYLFPCLH
jgi:hypothetical protein